MQPIYRLYPTCLGEGRNATVPVISLNASGLEKNPGLKVTPKLLLTAMQALVYGDVFMRVLYKTRPYKSPGSANALHEKWKQICIKSLEKEME